MNQNIVMLLIFSFLSQSVFALTNESTTSTKDISPASERNSQWSVGTSLMTGTYSLTSGVQSGASYNVNPPLNIGIGYQGSKSSILGWSIFVNLASLSDDTIERNIIFMRVDPAVQFNLANNLSLNVGPTISRRFGGGRFSKNFRDLVQSHGLGYKAAIAKEISSVAALEFGYSETNVPIKDSPSFRFRGPEFGFRYLF